MLEDDINAGVPGGDRSGDDKHAALRAKIAERKKNLLVSKLPKRVLGTDKKLRSQIKRTELKHKATKKFHSYLDDVTSNNPVGIIPDENETTRQFRSENLAPVMSMQTVSQVFSLKLDFGEYNIDYSHDGKYLCMGGSKGHVALLDWKQKSLKKEWNVGQRIRDVKSIAQGRMVAVAQKDWAQIYDDQGLEIHRLRNMPEPLWLEYLNYHFLLCSISTFGLLSYQDVSTGQIVAQHRTKVRDATFLRQNPHNAILLTGNDRGVVRMWAPNSGTHLASIFCHSSHVLDAGVTRDGNYLATVGSDSKLNVFDLRTYGLVHSYFTPMPASNLAISQRGLLSLGCRDQVITWRDWEKEKQKAPYMKQETIERRKIVDLSYVPFEDSLGIGEIGGFEMVMVPGSGEANFDTFESGVGLSKKAKSTALVRGLLEKLPPTSITMNPNEIYTFRPKVAGEEDDDRAADDQTQKKRKNRTRGSHKTNKTALDKQVKRDQIRREMVSQGNIARLKSKMAEKVKRKKESHEVGAIEDEVMTRIPQMIRSRLEKETEQL